MTKHMPDIACQPHQAPQGKLNWVGMSGIELPILIEQAHQKTLTLSSQAQAYVSLDDPLSKGIHMSRLYLLLDEMGSNAPLTPKRILTLLNTFIDSHQGLSQNAFVEFKFDYYERRQSLKTDNSGWKHYPCTLRGQLRNGQYDCEISISVPYSSTCPCSAALSRQLIQEAFQQQFSDQTLDFQQIIDWLGTPEGICATPHSQRSYAQITLKVTADHALNLSNVINQIGEAVKTPAQATVKRQDEQEVERLNATNLTSGEDAARRLQSTLESGSAYTDYWVRVNHLESLHPHNAVAIVTKNVPSGYSDEPNFMDAFEH